MSELSAAEELNEQGNQFSNRGDKLGAEAAYRAALDAAPEWSVPFYNLGLLCKYQRRWEESFAFNLRATVRETHDEASWWNFGIAATALSRWSEARRAWRACGMSPPLGDGPPDFGWGLTPVRLDEDGDGEVVWARRIDPARATIVNVPVPTSRFQWGDVVLTDGTEEGQPSLWRKRRTSVFNVLERLEPSTYRKFVMELAAADEAAIDALERIAEDLGGAAENWGRATRILCRACSHGTVHDHPEGGLGSGAPASRHRCPRFRPCAVRSSIKEGPASLGKRIAAKKLRIGEPSPYRSVLGSSRCLAWVSLRARAVKGHYTRLRSAMRLSFLHDSATARISDQRLMKCASAPVTGAFRQAGLLSRKWRLSAVCSCGEPRPPAPTEEW